MELLEPKKSVTYYEKEQKIVDITTGEIIKEEVTTHKKSVTSEPDYIKIYYKTMMAVNKISEIPLDFLLALSAQIGFTNGDKILFYNNKTTRRAISDYCGIGDNMTAKYIRRAVTKGVLFSTQDRGTYEVNPWLIAKGRWEHIKELQASFCFVDGKWTRIIEESATTNEDIDNKNESKNQKKGA